MLTETILNAAKKIICLEDINLDTRFSDIGLDSTNVVELLVEAEILFDIDVLDDNLNLDEMETVNDVIEYLSRFINR